MDVKCRPFLASAYIHHMSYFPLGTDAAVPVFAVGHYVVSQQTDHSSLPCTA